MIQAVLFDVDGVVLFARDKYFSQRLKEDHRTLNHEQVGQFFKKQYKQIVVGKADLKEELAEVLTDWGWRGTVDELLEYWFAYENNINQDVVHFAQELRQKGVKCYLASDHSSYRKQDLLDSVGLAQYFDGAFFSADLGYTKEEKEYYQQVLNRLNLSPSEVVFVDDDPENTETAQHIFPYAIVFTSTENLRNDLVKDAK